MGNTACCSGDAARRDDQSGSEGIDGVLTVIDDDSLLPGKPGRGERPTLGTALTAVETEEAGSAVDAEQAAAKLAEEEATRNEAKQAAAKAVEVEASQKVVEEAGAKAGKEAVANAREAAAKAVAEVEAARKPGEADEATRKIADEEAATEEASRKAQEEVAKNVAEAEIKKKEEEEEEAKRKALSEKKRKVAAKKKAAAKKKVKEMLQKLTAPPGQLKKAAAQRRAAARRNAVDQQKELQLQCGNCSQVFSAPPGHINVKCPRCLFMNACPAVHATIPQMLYDQPVGVYPAPVVNQPGPPPSGKKRALLIGINYFGTEAELRGCINDVHRMLTLITSTFGFLPENIRILTDNAADSSKSPTREHVLRDMRWLVQDVQPGDCLFFHYSGHGAQQQDPKCAEDDCYDETICPEDFEEAGMIVDDESFDTIVGPLPHGVKLTAVMDCCHSGTGLDLPFVLEVPGCIEDDNHSAGDVQLISGCQDEECSFDATSGTALDIPCALEVPGWIEDDNPCHSAGDVQLISGCQDEECSFDATDRYNRPSGALTTALCDILERDSKVTYPDLLQELQVMLEDRGYDQLPSLSSSQRFETSSKTFSLTDGIVGNMNPELGRHFRKKKHPKREDILSGGLGEMLGHGALGFMMKDMLAQAADGQLLGGLAMGMAGDFSAFELSAELSNAAGVGGSDSGVGGDFFKGDGDSFFGGLGGAIGGFFGGDDDDE